LADQPPRRNGFFRLNDNRLVEEADVLCGAVEKNLRHLLYGQGVPCDPAIPELSGFDLIFSLLRRAGRGQMKLCGCSRVIRMAQGISRSGAMFARHPSSSSMMSKRRRYGAGGDPLFGPACATTMDAGDQGARRNSRPSDFGRRRCLNVARRRRRRRCRQRDQLGGSGLNLKVQFLNPKPRS
jgi:hypothetical protein